MSDKMCYVDQEDRKNLFRLKVCNDIDVQKVINKEVRGWWKFRNSARTSMGVPDYELRKARLSRPMIFNKETFA